MNQILKDLELLKSKITPVKSLQYEFSRSPITGKIGPTKPLLKFLKDHDIEVQINY